MKVQALWVALGVLAISQPAFCADDMTEGAYAYRAPLPILAGAPLQRVAIPPQVLVRLQEADQSDLRIFNAQGQPLSMARLPARPSRSEQGEIELRPLPVLGAPGALAVTGVILQVDEKGLARVIGVNGAPEPPKTVLLGVLLDVRGVRDPATRLRLTTDIPAQQPVTFQVESSSDLAQWNSLAEVVAYRSPGDRSPVTLALARPALEGSYLRVTWRSANRLLGPVVVRGAMLTTEHPKTPKVERAEISGAKRTGSHELDFGLPFGTPVTALQLTPAGQNTILPIRILGRADSEQPWTLLASGTASSLQGTGGARVSPAIPLQGGDFRFIRVEADKRTSGFTAPPRVQVQLEPRDVVILVTGGPPFTIAAGLKGANSNFLPLDSLMAASPGVNLADLPLIEGQPHIPVTPSVDDGSGGLSARILILWGVLLGATAILGFIAWLVSRKPAQGMA
jgi:hypothetical protein